MGSTVGSGSRTPTGLGLSIVRTLVTTELNGTIVMRPLTPPTPNAPASTPTGSRRGTVVELAVPIVDEE